MQVTEETMEQVRGTGIGMAEEVLQGEKERDEVIYNSTWGTQS